MFLTFHGPTRADRETFEHAHESPWVMLVPLIILALGAVAAGFAFEQLFVGHDYQAFWRASLFQGKDNHIMHAMHEVPEWVSWSPTLAMLAGLGLAYVYYIAVPALPAATATAFRPLYLFLLNKWYFDELYDWLFVRPAMRLGRILWKGGDGVIIDGLGPDGIASRVLWTTGRVVRLQTGYVYHYAFAMLIGVALLVTWFMFYGGVGR
jgi:NADH-quinone oxidoreductase subunit L